MKRSHPVSIVLLCMAIVATPLRLSAQTQPPIRMWEPAQGSRVFGTLDVSVLFYETYLDYVQFLVDGQPYGEPLLTPPYKVSWNSTALADGWHTLSATGRDNHGVQQTATPVAVRVANTLPPTVPTQRYEETAVNYGPGWQQRDQYDWLAWSGGPGSAMEASTAGAQASFPFNGTSVGWLGFRGNSGGIARVSVDGHFIADVDLFARRDENMVQVYAVGGLAPGDHVLTIEATGERNVDAVGSVVLIDAFETPARAVSRLQESHPWGPVVQEDRGTLNDVDTSKPWSGGSAYREASGGALYSFLRGQGVRWIGYRGPDGGIARVQTSGGDIEIDTYSPHPQIQAVLFENADLPGNRATNEITISATGRANPASTGAYVVIDAIEVTDQALKYEFGSGKEEQPLERFEQDEWSVSYEGPWYIENNKPWSGGTAMMAWDAGATAEFRFVGTGVSWIGFRSKRTGIVEVSLDDEPYRPLDTYLGSGGEGYQETQFYRAGLDPGEHSLKFRVTGTKNPQSENTVIIIDAFDVLR